MTDVSTTIDGVDLPVFCPSGRHQALLDSQPGNPSPSQRQALKAVSMVFGATLYAFTFGPFLKLGWTEHLDQRFYQLRHQAIARGYTAPEFLGFAPGTREDEGALHRSLAASVAEGREWYNPTPDVLAVINDWRDQLGRDPIAA